jgi:hypothetical protein
MPQESSLPAKPDGQPLEAELAQTKVVRGHRRMFISRNPELDRLPVEGAWLGPASMAPLCEQEE